MSSTKTFHKLKSRCKKRCVYEVEVATGWDRRSVVTSSLVSATWEAYTKIIKYESTCTL